jgi:hypothetical protein
MADVQPVRVVIFWVLIGAISAYLCYRGGVVESRPELVAIALVVAIVGSVTTLRQRR